MSRVEYIFRKVHSFFNETLQRIISQENVFLKINHLFKSMLFKDADNRLAEYRFFSITMM